VTLGRTEVNNGRTLCLLMEFAKMMLDHKSNDVTEEYIRVSAKMRLRFYDYAELIVGDKSADHGNNIRLFMDKTT
jgi:hypothetical protein